MRITTDDLGVVAIVLPGAPNSTFELSEWPDGSFSLEPVASAGSPAVVAAVSRVRGSEAPGLLGAPEVQQARTA